MENKCGDPTDPFAILEHQNPSTEDFYVVQNRQSPDFEALNGLVGEYNQLTTRRN